MNESFLLMLSRMCLQTKSDVKEKKTFIHCSTCRRKGRYVKRRKKDEEKFVHSFQEMFWQRVLLPLAGPIVSLLRITFDHSLSSWIHSLYSIDSLIHFCFCWLNKEEGWMMGMMWEKSFLENKSDLTCEKLESVLELKLRAEKSSKWNGRKTRAH
jgi:hypothetical protein